MKTLIASTALVASLVLPMSASASLQASVTIEQVTPGQFGVWTILSSDGTAVMSSDAGVTQQSYSYALSDFGPKTLSVSSPAGMKAMINVYRNNELMTKGDTPQVSFTPYPNDKYRFQVQYVYSLLGSLGVTSLPNGAKFRLKGPIQRTLSGKTPKTFINLPAGKYTLIFQSTKDCLLPAPYSTDIVAGERNTAFVMLQCDTKALTEDAPARGPSKRAITESVKAREAKPRGERK